MKPAGPVIGVLALQGDVPEHLRALEAAGAQPAPVRRPEELHRIDGLVNGCNGRPRVYYQCSMNGGVRSLQIHSLWHPRRVVAANRV